MSHRHPTGVLYKLLFFLNKIKRYSCLWIHWSHSAEAHECFQSPGLPLLFFAPRCSPGSATGSVLLVAGRHSISVTALTSAGNIGENSILGCTFEPDIKLSNVVIQWVKDGVAGLVHEYRDGKDQLHSQDETFQGRTAVFAEQVISGNASLMLRDVQLSDAGTYRCSVTTSKGNGEAVLEYKTGGKENLVREAT